MKFKGSYGGPEMDISLVNMYEKPERWFWKMVGHFIAVTGAVKQTIVSGVVKS